MDTINNNKVEPINNSIDLEDIKQTINESSTTNKKSSKSIINPILITISSIIIIAILGLLVYTIKTKQSTQNPQYQLLKDEPDEWETLPGCNIHEGVGCKSSSGKMDEKFKNNLWNTPIRNSKRWIKGFQDMGRLVGYAQQKYSSDLKKCTVSIYTRTIEPMELTYFFDDMEQTSNSKEFDSSYKGLLKVKVKAKSGETLELDDIDFIWNVGELNPPKFNTKNGQKGAIVEMFGWPDEDIEQECKFIGEAGYLGVKLFPHQEQVMSYQPFNDVLNPWYFMYQPVSYKLNGRMGTRAQLRKMINTCRKYGVRVYADAVVNHMTGNGNDLSRHRNPGAGCNKWGNKTSSAEPNDSPYYTPAFTYEINPFTKRGTNALEFPGVPYGPMDFHCEKPLNSWTDANNLNTGWLTGLADLDTSQDYVRQRIADYFTDLMSIGFSGFRIDAAKHIHPSDLAVIFKKFKDNMGGALPDDFITWLEVLTGGESWLLVQGDGDYSFTGGLTKRLQEQGMTHDEIEKIKIWWSGYPVEPGNDRGSISKTRKVIQNDDHDQQNPGSSSRDMHDEGCVLVKGCDPDRHREFERRLFLEPKEVDDNRVNYPIRMLLSSYYFTNDVRGIPDGKSDCSKCTTTCQSCRSMGYVKAHVEGSPSYTKDYTRVHRDPKIIEYMSQWMQLN